MLLFLIAESKWGLNDFRIQLYLGRKGSEQQAIEYIIDIHPLATTIMTLLE